MGLATIGTYGVLAYLVSQGRRELAIRMALGATRPTSCASSPDTAWPSPGPASRPASAARCATRLLDTVLFEVSARDPLTFAAVTLALAVIALLASITPAWRATRIDSVAALSAD